MPSFSLGIRFSVKGVLDGVLLPSVDPTGEDQEQQMPWLKLGLHVPPDALLGPAAFGIVRTLRVEEG